MQNNTQYTRCPQCKTAFKVNEKMLSMAHGKVRCGACLEVFQATDHILQPRAKAAFQTGATIAGETKSDEAPAESEPAGSATQTTESSAANTPFTQVETPQLAESDPLQSEMDIPSPTHATDEFSTPEDDDLGLTTSQDEAVALDDMQLSADARATDAFQPDFETSKPSEPFAADVEDFDPVEEAPGDDIHIAGDINDPEISFDHEDDITDSNDAAELALDDDFVDAIESSIDSEATHDNANQPAENNVADTSLSDQADATADGVGNGDLSEKAAQAQKADVVEEDDLSQKEKLAAQNTLTPDTAQAASDDADESAPSLADFDETIDSDQLALADTQALEALSDNLADQISDTDTEPDPLEEFEGRVEKKKTSLRTLVISATLVILLSWLSVNFWSHRQTLAYDATWGGVTQGICSLLPCNIQPRRDVDQIRLRQRIVTPSEAADNQLDVKMLLVNEASFAQPYPQITIKFSNSLGEQVAVKQFTVADYFPEKQAQLMPAGTEVHITFTTELPHPDALGFEFSFQ